jgi:hypothetical protein
MAVHVDEVHTDVVPAVAAAVKSGQGGAAEHLGAAEESWRDARRAELVLARRTSAEGFDD